MFDHLGLHVRDLVKSCRFYEAALAPLGYAVGSRDATGVSFMGPPGAPALYLYPGKHSADAGTHLAWTAKERSSVKQFHEGGLSAGGKDNGAPGIRADYAENYYAAFLIDPDGNNVEAVCYAE
ncbi:MAG TPA: VOC family protein [Polyangiaceae bacterium]|nr:VOC family protein [Polyangiaceae bacterium]